MADLNKIVEDLSSLSVIEAAELSKLLEEKWGVSAAAPAAAAPAAAAGEPAAEEKTDFDVVLTETGANKIAVIKEVRTMIEEGITDPNIIHALSNLQPLWHEEHSTKSGEFLHQRKLDRIKKKK